MKFRVIHMVLVIFNMNWVSLIFCMYCLNMLYARSGLYHDGPGVHPVHLLQHYSGAVNLLPVRLHAGDLAVDGVWARLEHVLLSQGRRQRD